MSEKILFTDLDGTLLTSDKKISPYMQQLLSDMVRAGHHLVLTSGRALSSILKVAERSGLLFPDTLIIAANGNEIYDCSTGDFLVKKSVPTEIAQGVINLAHSYGIHIQSYDDTHVVCEKDCPEVAQYKRSTGMDAIFTDDIMGTIGHAPYKLLAIHLSDRSRLDTLRQEVLSRYGDTVTAIFSCDEYLEVFDKTAGKGNAIRFICDYLSIPITDVVAAGDAENDISMLDAAGIGVAMANADSEVKKHADFITQKDNDHDGLSEAILRFFG